MRDQLAKTKKRLKAQAAAQKLAQKHRERQASMQLERAGSSTEPAAATAATAAPTAATTAADEVPAAAAAAAAAATATAAPEAAPASEHEAGAPGAEAEPAPQLLAPVRAGAGGIVQLCSREALDPPWQAKALVAQMPDCADTKPPTQCISRPYICCC